MKRKGSGAVVTSVVEPEVEQKVEETSFHVGARLHIERVGGAYDHDVVIINVDADGSWTALHFDPNEQETTSRPPSVMARLFGVRASILVITHEDYARRRAPGGTWHGCHVATTPRSPDVTPEQVQRRADLLQATGELEYTLLSLNCQTVASWVATGVGVSDDANLALAALESGTRSASTLAGLAFDQVREEICPDTSDEGWLAWLLSLIRKPVGSIIAFLFAAVLFVLALPVTSGVGYLALRGQKLRRRRKAQRDRTSAGTIAAGAGAGAGAGATGTDAGQGAAGARPGPSGWRLLPRSPVKKFKASKNNSEENEQKKNKKKNKKKKTNKKKRK